MKWTAACLRNKLLIIILVILLSVLGLFSLLTRPVSPFPEIDGDSLIINLTYPGANAQTVQQQVTSAVVQQLEGVDNIYYNVAISQAGMSTINIQLNNADPLALLHTQIDIMQAINAAHLPAVVPQPEIYVSSGQSGLISFMAFSDTLTQFQMGNFLQANFVPQLSSLPGVKVMNNFLTPIVRIKLDPLALAKYQLPVNNVVSAISANYQNVPLGNIYVNQKAYALSFKDSVDSLEGFKHIIVGYKKNNDKGATATTGLPIYLQDIASIAFEPREITEQPYNDYNGHLGARLWVSTFSTADPFAVTKSALAALEKLKQHLPADMKIIPDFDMSKIMASSIKEVSFTIGLASVLVLLVALIFLGHLRTTIIPIVTIPICLLGAVLITGLLNFDITIISLLAMVVAVGLVVDDAIVVVENITRHIENGASKTDAVLHGSADIIKVIIGITLTLLAVYIPIIFAAGWIAAILKPFALTLAAAVFISGILSLTLTPIMAQSLVVEHEPNRYQRWFDGVLHAVIKGYQAFLKQLLKAPKTTLLLIVLILCIAGYFAAQLPKKVFPDDPNNLVAIMVDSGTGDDVNSLRKKLQLFSTFYHQKTIEYSRISVEKDQDTGLWQGIALIKYKPQYIRENQQFADAISDYIKKHKISNVTARMLNFSNVGGDHDIAFYVYGDDLEKTQQYANRLVKLMQATDKFSLAGNDIIQPEKQLAFKINTVKAARLDIYRQDIAGLLSTYYGGTTLNDYFSISGLSVPIVVQLNNTDRTDPKSIEKLVIQSPFTQKYYPLSDFVSLQMVAKPQTINTFNNLPAVKMFADLNKGVSLGKGIDVINQLLANNSGDVQYQYVSSAADYLKGNKQTLLIAVLGILCVYFLLTIIFRNLLDPFIIMLTVPFSVIGGAVSLYLVHGSLNFYSVLGLITLIGLITKHGVLIVQFANTELEKGADVLKAILLATHHRFRPIMMTTFAMTLGVLPLTLSDEIMYASREQLGIVIIGGLLIGTLFSLFIVPIAYVLMKKIERKA